MPTDPATTTASPEGVASILARLLRLPELPEGWKRTWRFIIDGQEVTVNRHFVAFLESPGRPAIGWSFGLIDDGRFQYDGCCFTEFGGGGVAMAPFAIINEELWVFTTLQFRFLVGQIVDGFPRGYRPEGVDPRTHAMTEAMEEFFGTSAPGTTLHEPFALAGNPTYGASHICDTRPLPNEPKPGGHQFAIQLGDDCFEETLDNEGRPILKDGVFRPSDKLEALSRGRALRWWEAAECSEGVIHTGVLRLMATLRAKGITFK
jgi:hypothetical protein